MLKNLKALRAERNISQQHLADIIGVSQQSINKYENHNIEPDINTLKLLSDYFETSIDYLVGNTDIKHKIEPVFGAELNEEELDLISDYRKLSKSEKESITAVIANYLYNKK